MESFAEALTNRMVLRTPRLLLRTPTEQDIPAIIAIVGDWEVASRLARVPHPYAEADARFFLDVIVPAELVWAIVERTSEQMVGVIGFAMSDYEQGAIELGYYVARDHWRRGVATEAGSAVVAYGLGLFGPKPLRSRFFADNLVSGSVLEKLGFTVQGTSERLCLAAGGNRPSVEVAYVV